MNMYIIYWVFYMFFICVAVLIGYYWNKIKENETVAKYTCFFLIILYLFCGPFYCILQTSYDIEQAIEYQQYQQQVITPIQEQYNNATLPDGYYYLGCEIVNVEGTVIDGEYEYLYSFGVVDYEKRDDIYTYSSNQMLNPNVPYLLVMDSLGTNKTTDDVIDVVWACVN